MRSVLADLMAGVVQFIVGLTVLTSLCLDGRFAVALIWQA